MVEKMATDLGVDVRGLLGNKNLIHTIDLTRYIDERRGLPTLKDILFRLQVKGVTALIAHPERCMEFEQKGRAAEAVGLRGLVTRAGVSSKPGRLASSPVQRMIVWKAASTSARSGLPAAARSSF